MLLTRSPLEYPASRAFPFDLHVLSTPPAFVLSQDQTLHKKISEQNSETGREKPETQQKKQTTTNHTTMQPVLASKKLLQRKIQSPQPDGVKNEETTKVEHNHMPTNPSQCSRNTKQHSKRYVFHIPNRHTPTNKPPRPAGRQTNQHTTMHTKNKKYIGTLLSSQTSSPHNNHTLSHVARREQKIYFVRACFPIAASARNFAVPVGRCRSR